MKTFSRVMIVAGEASGDLHAAKLVDAMRKVSPGDIEFFGSAGPRLRDTGVEAVVRADDLAIMGLPEIARALPMFIRAFRRLQNAAATRKPDIVILVDFPEFNLKLAKSLKKAGHTVIYYISPQLWAWRRYRKRAIEKYVDLLISIFPFEKAWYTGQGIDHVEYVGNPLSMDVRAKTPGSEFRAKYGLAPDGPLVALLPGSRAKEISRIFPIMLQAAEKLSRKIPNIQFVAAFASLDAAQAAPHLFDSNNSTDSPAIASVYGETYDALNASDAAAVTSGTATLEAALIGTPLTVVYRTSALNFRMFMPLIDVPHIGLVNLIAEDRLATELIQEGFTADSLAADLERLLNPEVNSVFRSRLKKVGEKMGVGGASERAASLIQERFGA